MKHQTTIATPQFHPSRPHSAAVRPPSRADGGEPGGGREENLGFPSVGLAASEKAAKAFFFNTSMGHEGGSRGH
jgi:hypothetical protein